MPSTKTKIISNAFVLLGKKQINTLDTGNPVHQAASDLYDILLADHISGGRWGFNFSTKVLTPNTTSPDSEKYGYAYTIPGDVKLTRGVWPVSTNYEIFENEIWCNNDSLRIYYAKDVNTSVLPDYFVLYMTYDMAAHLAMTITEKEKLLELWTQKATLQKSRALALDSQQYPTPQIILDGLYSSKFGNGRSIN